MGASRIWEGGGVEHFMRSVNSVHIAASHTYICIILFRDTITYSLYTPALAVSNSGAQSSAQSANRSMQAPRNLGAVQKF